MTIKELKELLSKYPDDAKVWLFNHDDQMWWWAEDIDELTPINKEIGGINIAIVSEGLKGGGIRL